jgi:Protein of unknown function (DUF3108)
MLRKPILALVFLSIAVLGLGHPPAASTRSDGSAKRSSAADPFAVGERLSYDVSWADLLTAGELILEVEERLKVDGVDAFHVSAIAQSVGLGALVYKVNDRYDSFINTASLLPFRAQKDSRRGKRHKTTSIEIDQDRKMATLTAGSKLKLPSDTYDMAGLMYAFRTMNLKDREPKTFMLLEDDKLYTISAQPDGSEKIETRVGRFDAVRLAVRVIEQGKANDRYKLRVYLTNDTRRVPILVTADPRWGQIHVEITSATGLEKR